MEGLVVRVKKRGTLERLLFHRRRNVLGEKGARERRRPRQGNQYHTHTTPLCVCVYISRE